jgi:uncharacterized YccA/Bax inhibitor family protein
MALNSNNPFLKKGFDKEESVETHDAVLIDYGQTMTVSGAMNKSFILMMLLLCGATACWWLTYSGVNTFPIAFGSAIVGFILVLIASFKPANAGYLAPGYAIFEGLFIGAISAIFEARYPGVVIEAVGATFVTFLICLALYRFRIVKVTEQFKSIVIAATLAIITYYILSTLAHWIFGYVPVDYGNSLTSIGISAFVIIIAAMNLFLDFDLIEQGAKRSLPKYMEWFSAMALMITLVWLYVEFLKLFAKLARRS